VPLKLNKRICERARLARDPRFDGYFFIGVLSTGVYCRTVCPSRAARPANVRFFPSAAAAEAAGFRPCLRCRPDAAPGTPAWSGAGAISLALRLIADGAVERSSLSALSERMGLSPRHLHRLFRLHLGASPSEVALTRRLHFAKELISDTDLPMAAVAMSSGFGSIRRFNGAIRQLWGRTPSELRRRPNPAPDGAGYVLRIGYRPPYDWASLLAFLSARAIPGVEEVASGQYRRTFRLAGQAGLLGVRKVEGALEARILFPDPRMLLPIVTRLRDVFDASADPQTVTKHFRRDALLGPLVRRYPGLRIPGAWDGFELAVRAILGQQVSVAAASALAGRLVEGFGEPFSIPHEHRLRFLFPEPKALAEADIPFVPRFRARAIRALASEVAHGRVALGPCASEKATHRSLVRISGIGHWTAQYVAMRALGQPDAFPAEDLVLRRAAGQGVELTPRALRARAEGWRPWRGYAAMYLWRGTADGARGRACGETPDKEPHRGSDPAPTGAPWGRHR